MSEGIRGRSTVFNVDLRGGGGKSSTAKRAEAEEFLAGFRDRRSLPEDLFDRHCIRILTKVDLGGFECENLPSGTFCDIFRELSQN